MRDLVQSGDWLLVNSMEGVVKGGPFTRRDPATGRESCLDLFICSAGLAPYVKSLEIDRERKWEVARPVRRRGKLQLIYSNHYPMLCTLQKLPAAQVGKQTEKEAVWNIAKENGWQKYENLSVEAGKNMEDIIENDAIDIDKAVEKIKAIETKLKFRSFGKCSLKSKKTELHC